MNITLSKTDYLLYRQCPKNLWLKIHKPEIYYKSELSEFEKLIIETGNEVELVARQLFPTGVLIEDRDEKSQKKTIEYINGCQETIFQPVFLKHGFLAACDIIKYDKKSHRWSLYEIKASNSIKEKTHLYDLAFQVNLLKLVGIELDRIHLLHLNPKYVKNGSLNLIKLFTIDDVTQQVNELLEPVQREMGVALAYITSDKEPSGQCICLYKGRSGHCSTFAYSNPQIPEYSIHDLARIGLSKAKLTELVDNNVFDIHQIPERIELSEIQKNQIDAHILDRAMIKRDKIILELGNLIFPLYFLDYETYPSAIPKFDGFSPYQQIPFQYSLHVIEAMDAEPKHFEFLHIGQHDPSQFLGESLKKNVGKIGSVIVWNKKFECKINKELAKRIPEMKKFIDEVNVRVYDLMDIFTKQYYVHKKFRGSTSIKAVLPVLVPELTYSDLEIQDGGTATQKWNLLTTGNIDMIEKERIAKNLKEYCKLDTFAMYSIWKHLNN